MKKEIYSCLKTLEALHNSIHLLWVNGMDESVNSLQTQYSEICNILKQHLSEGEFKMIKLVKPVNFSMIDSFSRNDVRQGLLQELLVASKTTLAYLRSLDTNLSEELIKEKEEIKKMKDELELKTKEIESLKKVFSELVDIKRGIPELIRSQITSEIKKSHREIEQNTNPNTKSQRKNEEQKIIEESLK